jgi:hypothetical protein
MILSRIHAATNKRGRARTVVIYFDVAVIVMSRYIIHPGHKGSPWSWSAPCHPPELQLLGAAQKEADRRGVPAYARANGPNPKRRRGLCEQRRRGRIRTGSRSGRDQQRPYERIMSDHVVSTTSRFTKSSRRVAKGDRRAITAMSG